MYKPTSIFCLLFIVVLLIPSCYDENNSYGERLVESAFRNVVTDTTSVTLTSVLIDSLETSAQNLVMVGSYTHPLWGTISASSYIPYACPSYGTDIEEVVVLDSFILNLAYTGQFVGDTLPVQQIAIHLLTEKITLNDNGYLYNNSSVRYAPDPLAVFSFRAKPQTNDTLTIRLPDELGEELLERFHLRDDAVSTDRFEEYFKGITIRPSGETNSSLMNFHVADSSATLQLFYHIMGEKESNKEIFFTPNSENQFNQISHDRTGTLMENYPARHIEIPSAELGNRGFLFGGIGWYTRLEFPHLNNIMQQGERVQIESALLKIYPEYGTYSDLNVLPDSIYLYIADENNVVTNAVTDYLGSQVQSSVLVKDDTYYENTYYYFDITDFIQQDLGTIGMYKHNLQLVFESSDYTGSFKNMTFSDQQGKSPITLQLIYKIYESY